VQQAIAKVKLAEQYDKFVDAAAKFGLIIVRRTALWTAISREVFLSEMGRIVP
jgi:hypothetical protein